MKPKDKKMLDIGRKMTDLIKFEKKTKSIPIDDLDAYEEYIKIFGEVNVHRSKIVNQVRAEMTKKFIVVIVRYREDLKETMRMVVKGEQYQIESITPLTNENLYLEVTGYRYMDDMGGVYGN